MKNTLIFLILVLNLGNYSQLNANVVNSAANGFVIESKVIVASSSEQAYSQFMRIGEWWDGEHSWFGSADNFTISNKVGGCFCEIEGDKQVQHMQVVFINPNQEVRLIGGLGPLQMMGVHGAMSWKFEQQKNGGTEITHRYTVSGYYDGGLDQLASVVDAVQTSQLRRLSDKLSKN